MELEFLDLLWLGLGAALICTAHLCAGFVGGYRFVRGREIGKTPAHLPSVIELLTRSQELQSQMGLKAQELPERLMSAITSVLRSAEVVRQAMPSSTMQRLGEIKSHTIQADRSAYPASQAELCPDVSHWVPQASDESPVLRQAPDELLVLRHVSDNSQGLRAGLDSLSQADLTDLTGDDAAMQADTETPGPGHRRPYPTRQSIAFCDEDLPRGDAFEQVICNDVSMCGISFFLNRRPDAQRLVISLGTAPDLTFMLAKVQNFRIAYAHDKRCFRIGCQFLRRLNDNEYRWNDELGVVE